MMSLPSVALVADPSPIQRLSRLEAALGRRTPRLFIKRDDLLPFGLGGNKVRKWQMLAPSVVKAEADTVITCGAVQSNHARVTAAVGAVLGWRVILVLSGTQPDEATGNLRYDRLFGADVRFVPSPEARPGAMADVAETVEREGRKAFVLPLGGSTPLGAIGMARAVAELSSAGLKPDLILHASSSAGTQAGLVAGCALFGLPTRVLGVSADEPAPQLSARIGDLLEGMADLLGCRADTLRGPFGVEVDDRHVGRGYGHPTAASLEAATLLARTEGIVLDQVYTAKAFAGLLARLREGIAGPDDTVLFWQTGGLL